MTVDGGDDGALVLAARAGDEQAFGRLFDRWFDPVHDIAWRIVRDSDTAADVAQDVFLAAWRGLDDLAQPGSFGGWVRRIARNKALNRLERERRSRPDSDAAEAALDRSAPDVDMTAVLNEREQNELVWAACAALGERDASLLDLHLRHGLPPADIAAELGVTTNNAHQLLHRLKGKLGGAIRAWVVWRRPGACADLDRAVADAGVTSFGAEALRVVDRHVRDCDACQERQELRLAPEALFSAVPIAAAPPAVKVVAASALSADGVPMTGSTSGPPAQTPAGDTAERADAGSGEGTGGESAEPGGQDTGGESVDSGAGDGGEAVDAGSGEAGESTEPAGQAEPTDSATSGDGGEPGSGDAAAETAGPGDGGEIAEPAGPGGGESGGAGDPGSGEAAAEQAGPGEGGVAAEPAGSGGGESAGAGSGDASGGGAPVSGNGQTPAEGAAAAGGSGPLAVAAGTGAATRTRAPAAKGDDPAARRRTLVLVGLAVLTALAGILVLLTSGARDDVATSADATTTSSSPTSSTSTSSTGAGGAAGGTPPADGQGPGTSPPTTAAPSTEPSPGSTTTTQQATTTSASTTTTTEPDPAPVIVRFAASAPGTACGSTRSAGDVNLAWAAENATEVSLADVNGLPPSGSIVVCAAPGDQFTLEASGPGGAAQATVTVPPAQ